MSDPRERVETGCIFFSSEFVMPGWGCCQCRVYNGLQRSHCKSCRHERCAISVPDTTAQCPECGFGVERGEKRWDVRCPVEGCAGVVRVYPMEEVPSV